MKLAFAKRHQSSRGHHSISSLCQHSQELASASLAKPNPPFWTKPPSLLYHHCNQTSTILRLFSASKTQPHDLSRRATGTKCVKRPTTVLLPANIPGSSSPVHAVQGKTSPLAPASPAAKTPGPRGCRESTASPLVAKTVQNAEVEESGMTRTYRGFARSGTLE